jgi:hypothetical protein
MIYLISYYWLICGLAEFAVDPHSGLFAGLCAGWLMFPVRILARIAK